MNTEIKKKKKMCYKEMTHTIMEADKPKTCSIDPQVRDPRKLIPWEFPASPVVRTQRFHCFGPDSRSHNGKKKADGVVPV